MDVEEERNSMIRFFDILFSLLAIIVLFPFMIPIMIGLKLTGEHDIFYGQERIGKDGKPFKLLKFATMLRNSPSLPGGLFTAENDPRMLPMGKFLRKTKINELPQLVNILIGQMSVIGYRPIVKKQYDLYSLSVRHQIEKVAPGLSGIGSIVFRNEEEILQRIEAEGGDKQTFHDQVITPYKGALEAWYVEHRSIGLYFKLIWMTVIAVLKPNDHSWETAFSDLPPVPANLAQYI